MKLCPGKGACQPYIWAQHLPCCGPGTALSWQGNRASLFCLLPGPPALGLLLPNPEKKSSSGLGWNRRDLKGLLSTHGTPHTLRQEGKLRKLPVAK